MHWYLFHVFFPLYERSTNVSYHWVYRIQKDNPTETNLKPSIYPNHLQKHVGIEIASDLMCWNHIYH